MKCKCTQLKMISLNNGLLSILPNILLLLIIILVVVTSVTLFLAFSKTLSYDCDRDILLNYDFWVKCLGGCVTLWVVVYNLKKYIDVEMVNAIGRLRDSFNDEKKKRIHYYLLDKEEITPILGNKTADSEYGTKEIDNIDLFDYLGTIELGAIMLERGVISVDEFNNQFGYRIDNLIANTEVLKYINENKAYYSKLIFAIEIRLCNDM